MAVPEDEEDGAWPSGIMHVQGDNDRIVQLSWVFPMTTTGLAYVLDSRMLIKRARG
jgi:hypothetical protein